MLQDGIQTSSEGDQKGRSTVRQKKLQEGRVAACRTATGCQERQHAGVVSRGEHVAGPTGEVISSV